MLGVFRKRKQDWQARIGGEGESITVKAGDNLLKSALEAGLPWPHDCRVGSCGTCRCTLKQGQVKELSDFSYVLSGEELESGMILACQSALRSDIVVEVDFPEDAEETVAVTSREGVIQSVTPLTHDIVELVVRTAGGFSGKPLAGQYADISTPRIDQPRSYSFAKAPENERDGECTFFVRQVPGGEFTGWLFDRDRTGEPVTVSGPYGSFWLRPGDGPIVCVAGGSGMAPVKALLESASNAGSTRDVLFLFGARTRDDLYCLDVMEDLGRNWKGRFEFVPVLSDESADSGWTGARGLVTDYLREKYLDSGELDMAACQGYLCGPPPMVDAAVEVLGAAGMVTQDIHFDRFLDASSMPGGRQ